MRLSRKWSTLVKNACKKLCSPWCKLFKFFLMLKTSESPRITEGKYWNQLEKIRNFRVVLTSVSHDTGSTSVAQDSKILRNLVKSLENIGVHFFFTDIVRKKNK